ncbi:MAG: T9SS type A sorting domain-containing protein [Bacteroidia bacterium]|nr:T9SS type A sorting domain-containing protein [Bacteroidia bacterium]
MKKTITLFAIIIALNALAQSGITWTTGLNIATSATGNEHPRIATDAAGNPLVLWGYNERAMFSRWNGTAFTAPVMLNPMTMTIAEASWMGPDIASHGDTVYVVFKKTPEADTASHIFIVRSVNGGASFSLPVRVDGITDTITRFPTVTTDAIGNPIVGFMKFNISFGNAQWAVATSADFGTTFSQSVLASGWSSSTSTVCDCCPGGVVNSGNTVAMLYRDNNSNIRDSWAGISTDVGNTFTSGINVDQNNWLLMSCPATGPDGVIIGDTLYSVFMNGAFSTRNYFSKTSISTSTVLANTLTGSIAGLSSQNYPRIATDGNAVAIVWKQYVSGSDQLPVLFTTNIASGFPAAYDTVDLSNITNADVAISNGNIYVVWQDDNSGTVKYRKGTFTIPTGVEKGKSENLVFAFPNPVADKLHFSHYQFEVGDKIEVKNILGEIVLSNVFSSVLESLDISGLNRGIYFVKISSGGQLFVAKIVKD